MAELSFCTSLPGRVPSGAVPAGDFGHYARSRQVVAASLASSQIRRSGEWLIFIRKRSACAAVEEQPDCYLELPFGARRLGTPSTAAPAGAQAVMARGRSGTASFPPIPAPETPNKNVCFGGAGQAFGSGRDGRETASDGRTGDSPWRTVCATATFSGGQCRTGRCAGSPCIICRRARVHDSTASCISCSAMRVNSRKRL